MATYEIQRVTTSSTITTRYVDDPALVELPQDSKHHQTLTWQNLHAHEDEERRRQKQQQQQREGPQYSGVAMDAQMTAAQAEELQRSLSQTRTARIRDAMFPETLVDAGNAYILTTQLYPGHTTAVQKLSDPAVRLKHAVINLINYQEDADVASMACSHLVPLLEDGMDKSSQERAAALVHQLSKKQACRHAFSQDDHLVPVLVKLMETTNDPQMKANICGALQHISRCEPGAVAIYRFGGIPALVRLLSSPTEMIVNFSITTLRNLLLFVDEAKPAVRLCGGIQKMVDLLQASNPKFLAVDADCLQLLAFNNQESKLIILTAGGPTDLIDILNRHNYEKLLYTTARVLKVLSVCTSNKPGIVGAKGMNALTRHLHSQSPRLMMTCLWTLRNLSDQAFVHEDLDDLLVTSVQLLRYSDPHVVTCCAGILCNLTCQNAHNKGVVVANQGVRALVQTLVDYAEREEVTEPLVCALRHITHRHDLALQALQDFAACQALEVLAQLAAPGVSRWPLLKGLVGLVRNLATLPALRQEMRALDVLASLAQLLLRAHTTQNPDKRASINSVASSYIEGVRMDDMVEGCLAALAVLSRDYETRVMIRQLNLVPLITQLLYSESEYLQRAAASLLYELTSDTDGSLAIEQEGASARLTELLHSRNEAVATYAAAVLYRLAADKPSDYRKRLSLELTESLQPRNPGYDLNSPPPLYNSHSLNGTLGANQTTVLDDQPINFGVDVNGQPLSDGRYAGNFPYGVSDDVEVAFQGGTLGNGSVNAAFEGSHGNLHVSGTDGDPEDHRYQGGYVNYRPNSTGYHPSPAFT